MRCILKYWRDLIVSMLLGVSAFSAIASPLQNHPSPYLRLHASDPVDWRAWNNDALAQAQHSNRLIFLSIGYFACHWCHVMQQESFKNREIAEFLNQHVVAVKVDRELRPLLDRRMLDFVEKITGRAGWPLNVFLTPEGYPVTGFTYLPPDEFLQVTQKLQSRWQQQSAELSAAARRYYDLSDESDSSAVDSSLLNDAERNPTKLREILIEGLMAEADELQGGFGSVSKFPSYPQLNALISLFASDLQPDAAIEDFVRLTLDRMSTANLMDHLNGGFYRYVVDPDWNTPHFEKMLYDNALLAQLYFAAHALWPERGYASVALRTIDFMLAFLMDADGGLRSSVSAIDTQGIEGGAYWWSYDELSKSLSAEELNLIEASSKLSATTSILLPANLPESLLQKLHRVDKPVMPVDGKKIAAWNALALNALLLAELHQPATNRRAQTDQLYQFIRDAFLQDHSMQRLAGDARAETTLRDYVYVAHAFQQYANQRGSETAAQLASQLVESAIHRYWIHSRWRMTDSSLIPGERGSVILQDDVVPSAQVMLLDTIAAMPNPAPHLKQFAQAQLQAIPPVVTATPFHYASFLQHLTVHLVKPDQSE